MTTSVLIAGDFCPVDRIPQMLGKGTIFSEDIVKTIKTADLSIVNLECPIVCDGCKPIVKEGPNLKCTEDVLTELKHIGFNTVTLANNHILDYGEKAVQNTIDKCKKLNINTVGAGKNIKDASQPLSLAINGKRISIINCCEHEFSIASDTSYGANPLNPINQFYSIRKEKKNSDYIIVVVHGGTEHFQLPSPRMQETYRFFIDAGADAVINHHQHCYSGYEVYKEKPIIYGLGNFCFDDASMRDSIWNEGYMVELKLEDSVDFSLIPYNQCNDDPIVRLLSVGENKRFNEDIDKLNKVIEEPSKLMEAYQQRCKSSKDQMQMVLSPYTGRIAMGLARRKLLPLFLGKKRIARILNFVECESHREKLVGMLKQAIRK